MFRDGTIPAVWRFLHTSFTNCNARSVSKGDFKGVIGRVIQDEFRERSLRSFLDIAILARLEDKPVNGYGLTVFFMKKFGVIMSTSTAYATLYAMERN